MKFEIEIWNKLKEGLTSIVALAQKLQKPEKIFSKLIIL